MSTNWTPTAGMRRAHDLVERIAAEAGAAESLITPLFKHRLVELVGGEIDEAIHVAFSNAVDRAAVSTVAVEIPLEDDFSETDPDREHLETLTGAQIGIVDPLDAGVRTNGHAKPTAQAESPAEKPKAAASGKKTKKKAKKGTLQLSGAQRRLADKALREAAAKQAMENLPVPVDGLERQ
jgi:hypothetical protein